MFEHPFLTQKMRRKLNPDIYLPIFNSKNNFVLFYKLLKLKCRLNGGYINEDLWFIFL